MADTSDQSESSDDDQVFIDYAALLSTEITADNQDGIAMSKIKSRAEIIRVLDLAGQEALEQWLTSDLFKPFWCQLWEECLLHKPKNGCGVKLKTVQNRLADGEWLGQRKYSSRNPDKSEWKESDYLACFLWWVKHENSVSNKGIFWHGRWTEDDKDGVIWSVKDYVRRLHTPSMLKKTGGVTFLGTGRATENRTSEYLPDDSDEGESIAKESELAEVSMAPETEAVDSLAGGK